MRFIQTPRFQHVVYDLSSVPVAFVEISLRLFAVVVV